jgi:FlaA1/EpsC-like NDP-sugar epimerase
MRSQLAQEPEILANAIHAQNVLAESEAAGVRRLIAVSTNEAVRPVNVMGMSTAIQERLATAQNAPNFVSGCVRVRCMTKDEIRTLLKDNDLL